MEKLRGKKETGEREIRTEKNERNKLTVRMTVIVQKIIFKEILITKPVRCTNFSNLFWNKTLHVSDSFSVHHRQCFTVHTAVVNAIEVC